MKLSKTAAALTAILLAITLAFAGCSDYNPNATLEDSAVDGASAVNIVKARTAEELGLPKDAAAYDMVGYMDDPYNIDGGKYKGNYVEVRVSQRTDNADGTINFDVAGYYLVSFDGSVLLSYEPGSDEYKLIAELDKQ